MTSTALMMTCSNMINACLGQGDIKGTGEEEVPGDQGVIPHAQEEPTHHFGRVTLELQTL